MATGIGSTGAEGGLGGSDGASPGEESSSQAETVTADNYIPAEGESASETARNISKLLSNETGNPEEGDDEEEQPQTDNETQEETQAAQRARDEQGRFAKSAEANKQATKPTVSTQTEDIQPPAVLDPAGKKAFMALPPEMKREAQNFFTRFQANLTRNNQEMVESRKRFDDSFSYVDNYIKSNDLRDEQGQPYSVARLNRELIQAHDNILKDKDRYIAQMIQNTGASPENISSYLQGKEPSGINISKHPDFVALQSKYDQLHNTVSQIQTTQHVERTSPLADAFGRVMHEVDQNGELLRPELQDDEFLAVVKPQVAALLRQNPALGPENALKKAYSTTLSLFGKSSTTQYPQQVPTSQTNYKERSRSAAISVRPKVSGSAPSSNGIRDLELHEIPNSPTETARMIQKMLEGAN